MEALPKTISSNWQGMQFTTSSMEQEYELPEGVTLNTSHESLELEQAREEVVQHWTCGHCPAIIEALLLQLGRSHQGSVRFNKIRTIWQNPVPRDRERAIKVLQENLAKKVERHLEDHKI